MLYIRKQEQIKCAVIVQLICFFVFVYAKSMFSYDVAHLLKRVRVLTHVNPSPGSSDELEHSDNHTTATYICTHDVLK